MTQDAGRVEAKRINDHVELVHADNPDTVLEVPRRDWEPFIAAVKSGAFDLETLNRQAAERVA
ncbi:hypothetical protein FH608_010845 [Nonomuraea phyllanthi]|uniref:Uncharacterized protein n=1 Tax=Nonomuraea phyllanthi TaxID=2219224 RepID=A0A5C4WT95_9ACTN|nr:hypothetical protein [Nonomuraea phyllanthi]KAB8195964.1 hypothetical protein FH608_010845 [Nonomuraea phyllanthi]QFY07418.1 hypothetical protein GBF35_12645 [Nonomuraea phyllanthi]